MASGMMASRRVGTLLLPVSSRRIGSPCHTATLQTLSPTQRTSPRATMATLATFKVPKALNEPNVCAFPSCETPLPPQTAPPLPRSSLTLIPCTGLTRTSSFQHHYAKGSAQRDGLTAALQRFRSNVPLKVPLLIGGKEVCHAPQTCRPGQKKKKDCRSLRHKATGDNLLDGQAALPRRPQVDRRNVLAGRRCRGRPGHRRSARGQGCVGVTAVRGPGGRLPQGGGAGVEQVPV